jgi:hypothetical protein
VTSCLLARDMKRYLSKFSGGRRNGPFLLPSA